MAQTTSHQGQGRGSVRDHSQSLDLPSGSLSPNMSVPLPGIYTVLSIIWRLIMFTFTLTPLRFIFIPSIYWLCNAWLFQLIVGCAINNFNKNNNNNNNIDYESELTVTGKRSLVHLVFFCILVHIISWCISNKHRHIGLCHLYSSALLALVIETDNSSSRLAIYL